MAPEVFGSETWYTAKVDVYSYGIIMYILLTRNLSPYGEDILPFRIIGAVSDGDRPVIPDIYSSSESQQVQRYVSLMKRSWHQQPELRPTFKEITRELMNI